VTDDEPSDRVARALWAAMCRISDTTYDYDNPEDWRRLLTEAERDVFRLAASQIIAGLGAANRQQETP